MADDGPTASSGDRDPGTAPGPGDTNRKPEHATAPGPALDATGATDPTGVTGPTGDDEPVANGSSRFGTPGRPLKRSSFLVGFTGAAGVLLAYTLYLGLRNATGILVLVVIALFLAVGLHPAVVRLRSWGVPHGAAVAVVALTVVLLLCGGVFALVPPIVTQTGQFIDQLPSYLESLRRNEAVNDLVERYDLMERVQSAANADTVGQALGGVLGGAQLVFGTVFRGLTVLVLTIYFLAYFNRLRELGYSLVPRSRRERVRLIGDEILTKVGAYMVGALSIAVLAGISTYVFALIVGLPYPFALAVVVAVTDLIPQIGATLGAVIVSLVGFATDLPVGIACAVFFLIYQQVENYLIYPKIMRRSVSVNEVAALVAALLGVSLLGVVGALIAIPAVAAFQLILREVLLPRQESR
ncbi:AI-2E family transporter [Micromonospora peucetia]|uniref:AI-2E family transporter n=1 Tax=Micromonospora peucetia TaxID=47871 RepID=A0A1C6VGJ9_9ACTN|nr:AI-2E family transporter [Micromonospora peucetia]MCX4389817.1 AI-2E family transporter [Micromonospora peucetia]WSA30283.1 AI-2E family transporter [Micromonospora peucetia]SCL65439.1 Predicted PurR-regulated permease PerM [Micromonospora peucetia]